MSFSIGRTLNSTIKFTVPGLLILFVIILPLFVDQLNGYFKEVLNKDFSVSQYYKFLLYALFVLTIFTLNKKYALLFCIYLSSFLLSIAGQFISDLPESGLYNDYVFFSRIYLFPLTYFFFRSIFTKHPDWFDNKKVFTVFNHIFLIIFLAVFMSLFGFGTSTYNLTAEGDFVGFSGYFYSANELSALFIIVVSMVIFNGINKNKFSQTALALGLSMMTGILIGTKTAFLSVLVVTGIMIIFYKIYHKKILIITPIEKKIGMAIGFLAVLMAVFSVQIYEVIGPLIARLIYKFNIHDNFLSFITSGRIDRIKFVIERFFTEYNIYSLLFGMGWTNYGARNMDIFIFGFIEMDEFDILGTQGIIGFILIYSFWIYQLYWLIRILIRRSNSMVIPVITSFVILFINSFVAGHTIYSSLVGLYLGFVVAFVRSHVENKEITEG